MTTEDKQLICEYMGWTYHVTDDGKWWNCIGPKGGNHLLDLNDAGLVVKELVKRKDIRSFTEFSWPLKTKYANNKNSVVEYLSYIFNASNFFEAFVEWRKGK